MFDTSLLMRIPYFQFSISSRCRLQLEPFVREVGNSSMRPPPPLSSSCSHPLPVRPEVEGSRDSTTTRGNPPSRSQTCMEGHTHISSNTTTQVSDGPSDRWLTQALFFNITLENWCRHFFQIIQFFPWVLSRLQGTGQNCDLVLETGRFLPVSIRVPWFLFWFWMQKRCCTLKSSFEFKF